MDFWVILHNVRVEERTSKSQPTAREDNDRANGNFPLFGKAQMTGVQALAEGADVFAASVGKFNANMESGHLHFQLKRDLTEHVWSRNS